MAFIEGEPSFALFSTYIIHYRRRIVNNNRQKNRRFILHHVSIYTDLLRRQRAPIPSYTLEKYGAVANEQK